MTTSNHQARPATRPRARPLMAWGTPVFQADFDGAGQHNPQLRQMILDAEKTDPDAALFGGINAVKSSQNLLTWDHPAIGWVRARITDAVTALTSAELGEAAREVTCGIQAEAWAVVYRSGGSLRPHTHHDSAWSGVYYVEAGDPGSERRRVPATARPPPGRDRPPGIGRRPADTPGSRPDGRLPRLAAALGAGHRHRGQPADLHRLERRLRQDLEPGTMTTATLPATGTVTRYWKTGLIITQADLTGIITSRSRRRRRRRRERCQVLPPGSVPGLDLLEDQFLASMNALAAAEAAPEVTGCRIEIQVWRDGYDQPAFSSQARYAGWTILAASPAPEHSESGCLAFADPRAGSAGTAMPGLPWGRQFLAHPRTRRARRGPRLAHLLRRPPRTPPAPHRRDGRLRRLAAALSEPPHQGGTTMTHQPSERAATSLRLEGPGLGLGLDPDEIDAYLAAVNAGLIVAETRCDKGMQDNFALRAETTVELTAS